VSRKKRTGEGVDHANQIEFETAKLKAQSRLALSSRIGLAIVVVVCSVPLFAISMVVREFAAFAGKDTNINIAVGLSVAVGITVAIPAAIIIGLMGKKSRRQSEELIRLRARAETLERQIEKMLPERKTK